MEGYPVPEFGLPIISSKLKKCTLHQYSKEEQNLRIQLAACYRLFEKFGWTDTIYGHITVKVSKNSFLINPFGLLYDEITASSLVSVDLDGKIVDSGVTDFGINKAGYVIHSAIHEVRDEVGGCVMHCHFPEAVAISCLAKGMLNLSQTSHQLGPISYHTYRGIVVDLNEKKEIQENFTNGNVLILRNHGIVTYGKSIPEAFMFMHWFIESSKIQCRINSRSNVTIPDDEYVKKSFEVAQNFNKEGVGKREFSAFMRRLDREDPSYRN